MQLYLLVRNHEFSLYDKRNSELVLIPIDGKSSMEFSLPSVNEDLEKLLKFVEDYFCLESTSEIRFCLLECFNKVISDNVRNYLKEKVSDTLSISQCIKNLIKDYSKNLDNHIDEYGINYDGSCYKLKNEKLYRGNYSLLAMNVDEEQIAKYIP